MLAVLIEKNYYLLGRKDGQEPYILHTKRYSIVGKPSKDGQTDFRQIVWAAEGRMDKRKKIRGKETSYVTTISPHSQERDDRGP